MAASQLVRQARARHAAPAPFRGCRPSGPRTALATGPIRIVLGARQIPMPLVPGIRPPARPARIAPVHSGDLGPAPAAARRRDLLRVQERRSRSGGRGRIGYGALGTLRTSHGSNPTRAPGSGRNDPGPAECPPGGAMTDQAPATDHRKMRPRAKPTPRRDCDTAGAAAHGAARVRAQEGPPPAEPPPGRSWTRPTHVCLSAWACTARTLQRPAGSGTGAWSGNLPR